MQGLITLDFGNSNPHAGLFLKNAETWELIKVVPWKEIQIYLSQLGMNADNSSVVLSEVKNRGDELQPLIEQGFLLTRIKEYWRGTRFAGMPVHYQETLGEDRLIEAFYCYKKSKTPTLLVDAGTFVTLDVLNAEGFLGGYIIPGTQAYFSCYEKGEQLKGLDLNLNMNSDLPNKTGDAIAQSYSAFGAKAREIIEEYKIEKVVLTGGASSLWKNFFNNLPVEEEPHLIHHALHYWFTTQIEPL